MSDREAMPFPDPDTLSHDELASVCARLAELADWWRAGLDLTNNEAVFMVGILESARGILRRRLDERLDQFLNGGAR